MEHPPDEPPGATRWHRPRSEAYGCPFTRPLQLVAEERLDLGDRIWIACAAGRHPTLPSRSSTPAGDVLAAEPARPGRLPCPALQPSHLREPAADYAHNAAGNNLDGS